MIIGVSEPNVLLDLTARPPEPSEPWLRQLLVPSLFTAGPRRGSKQASMTLVEKTLSLHKLELQGPRLLMNRSQLGAGVTDLGHHPHPPVAGVALHL